MSVVRSSVVKRREKEEERSLRSLRILEFQKMKEMLENLTVGDDLGVKELEDKVQLNANNKFGISVVGKPQGQKTVQSYKERLFRFLVRLAIAVARSGEKPAIAKNLIKWLREHSSSYAAELAKNTEQIVKLDF